LQEGDEIKLPEWHTDLRENTQSAHSNNTSNEYTSTEKTTQIFKIFMQRQLGTGDDGIPGNFVRGGGGVQKIKLGTGERGKGDRGAVPP